MSEKPVSFKDLMTIPHSQKKHEIEVYKVNNNYARLQDNIRRLDAAKAIDLSMTTTEELDAMNNMQSEIKESLEKRMYFVTPQLTDVVPFHYPNLLLFGACTGDGKSTIAANIVHGLFKEKRRTLVLSNEEFKLSVFNRVACLELGYNVNYIKTFTPVECEQVKSTRYALGEFIKVIDLESYGNANITSSIEGVEQVLSKLAMGEFQYDCVIVDYYQKVSNSQKNPSQEQWKVLQEFSNILDRFYKEIKAPIVVLAQLHPMPPKTEITFEHRVKLGKSVFMTCTFAMEVRAEKSENETQWICHKSRFGEQDKIVKTKWIKGKYEDANVEARGQLSVISVKREPVTESINSKNDPEQKIDVTVNLAPIAKESLQPIIIKPVQTRVEKEKEFEDWVRDSGIGQAIEEVNAKLNSASAKSDK